MKYTMIIPREYAKNIKRKYQENPFLWYETIIPKEKADEIKNKLDGDYSAIWHEHCEKCWSEINHSTKCCYVDETYRHWLCENCYNSYILKQK